MYETFRNAVLGRLNDMYSQLAEFARMFVGAGRTCFHRPGRTGDTGVLIVTRCQAGRRTCILNSQI